MSDLALEGADFAGSIEHPHLQVKLPDLARLDILQAPVSAVPQAALDAAVARFDPGHVGALAKVLPLVDEGDLPPQELPVKPQLEAVVDQTHVDVALAVGAGTVDVDVVARLLARSRGGGILLRAHLAAVGEVDAFPGVEYEAGSGVQQGETGIGVVDEHERRGVGAEVLDLVADAQAFLSQHGGNFTGQLQIGAENHRLAHLAADPDYVVLLLPGRRGADVFGRYEGDPAVQPQFLVFLLGVRFRMTHEGEAAGGEQAAEKSTHPAEPLGFVEGRTHVPGIAAETEGHAFVVRRGDVEATPGKQGKAQTGRIEDFDQAGAAFVAFHQLGAAGAGQLAHVSGEMDELLPGVILAEKAGHGSSPEGVEQVVSGLKIRRREVRHKAAEEGEWTVAGPAGRVLRQRNLDNKKRSPVLSSVKGRCRATPRPPPSLGPGGDPGKPVSSMGEILILTATEPEQRELARRMENAVAQVVAGKKWRSGRLSGSGVRLVETGIGAVNAAHALTCALQAWRPDLVLQVGVGGAYPGAGLALGDLVLASEEVYGDLGVRTGDGWRPAEFIGIPVAERDRAYFNFFPVDRDRSERARALLHGGWKEPAPALRVGRFVTVQECSGLALLGQERAARFNAVCENMEGAAAAHLCLLYGVPFVEVRSISNQVEDRRRDRWDLPLALARAQEAALRLLGEGGLAGAPARAIPRESGAGEGGQI